MERERTSSMAVMLCSNCQKETHVAYDEAASIFCFSCAFSAGAIDEDQWRGDNSEDFLLRELKGQNDAKKGTTIISGTHGSRHAGPSCCN